MEDSVGTGALAKVEEFLEDHPHLQVTRGPDSITVKGTPDTGFDVEMHDDGDEATIIGGGWHGHYYSAEDAAATFMWLLTPMMRIVIHYKGRHQVGWELHRDEAGTWETSNHGFLVARPFLWGRKRQEIFQNKLIDGPEPD